MNKLIDETQYSVKVLAKMSLVTALYVLITVFFSVISFGQVQVRISEIFNFLPLYDKRYIVPITLGVAISNMFSPLGIIDVVVGSVSTFFVLLLATYIAKFFDSMNAKMLITVFIFSFSMFTVAGQLYFFYSVPFFVNWLIIAIGEAISMLIGYFLFLEINKRYDLHQFLNE